MTALVKGSVARGRTPEAHVIKYARGGAVYRIEFYGRNFTRYFSELGLIFKKAFHLRPLNSRLSRFHDRLDYSSYFFCVSVCHKLILKMASFYLSAHER